MAMTDLAAQGPDRIVSLADIAARQKISLSYLEQLFRQIRQAGLVASVRGAQGGYKLTRAPDALNIASIIAAVDEAVKAHGCSPETNISCTGKSGRCLTHNLWGALESHIGDFLASVTVQDVVDGRFPVAEMEAAE